MNEPKILGNPEKQKGIEKLLRQAGRDSKINDIIEGKEDKGTGIIGLDDAGLENINHRLSTAHKIGDIAFSPFGSYLAVAHGAYLRLFLYNKNGIKEVASAMNSTLIDALAFSPKGDFIAAGCREGKTNLFSLNPEEILKPAGSAASPKGVRGMDICSILEEHTKDAILYDNVLCVADSTGEMQLTDIDGENNALIDTIALEYHIDRAAFNKGGKYLAVGRVKPHFEFEINILEMDGLKEIASEPYYNQITAMEFNYGCLAVGDARSYSLYDFDGKNLRKIGRNGIEFSGRPPVVTGLSFSPGAEYLAVATTEDISIYKVVKKND